MRKKLKIIPACLFVIFLLAFLVLLSKLQIRPVQQADTLTLNPQKAPPVVNQVDLKKPILDISGWQLPSQINYDALSTQIIGEVVRVQGKPGKADGSSIVTGEDKAYKTHITELQKRHVPVAVYAYVTGKNVAQMKKQAKQFYENAKQYQPTYYWLDVEVTNMSNMNKGIEAFRAELAKLGAKKIGIYAQDWFITKNKINTSKFDSIWMADYGRDTGYWNASPNTKLDYQMQQYTDRGKINGYSGYVDLNMIRTQANYDKLFRGKAQ